MGRRHGLLCPQFPVRSKRWNCRQSPSQKPSWQWRGIGASSARWGIANHSVARGGGKGSTCQCGRCKKCRFEPWVRKIPWSRKWQPTPAFLPGKSHGQRSQAGSRPGCPRVRHDLSTKQLSYVLLGARVRWRHYLKERWSRDFPGGPAVKNLPCNANPGQGTKTPHTTTGVHEPQWKILPMQRF